jgi:hypothetical protein
MASQEEKMRYRTFGISLLMIFLLPSLSAAPAPNRVTILYDAFGKSTDVTKDWGFSALVEYDGKRILSILSPSAIAPANRLLLRSRKDLAITTSTGEWEPSFPCRSGKNLGRPFFGLPASSL